MKRYQTGEAMLVVMVVILAVMWLGREHMGMMGGGHAEHSSYVAQQEYAGAMPAARESSANINTENNGGLELSSTR